MLQEQQCCLRVSSRIGIQPRHDLKHKDCCTDTQVLSENAGLTHLQAYLASLEMSESCVSEQHS